MTPQFSQQAQQKGNRWLASLLPSILAAVSFTLPVASASLAAATECRVIEDGGTIQGMTAWKGTALNAPPLILTVELDIYGGFVPSPALEVAPCMKSNRMVWGNTVNQEIAAIGVCLSRDLPKSARFTQTMITSIGKARANAQKPVMKFSVAPYDGKRQVRTIRTTPAEIETSARHKAPTIIGPVQEIQKPTLSDGRSMSQAVAALPSPVEFPSLSGGQPVVALNPFQNALQLLDNESSHLNLTTMLALDNRNCISGCP